MTEQEQDEKVNIGLNHVRWKLRNRWESIALNREKWEAILSHISTLEAKVKDLEKEQERREEIFMKVVDEKYKLSKELQTLLPKREE